VSEFIPDDLFVLDEIDLAAGIDPAPVDPAYTETVVETEFWSTELSTAAVPDVDQLATDLALPDPFRPRAGLGAGALLTAAQIVDTSVSIAQRLSGFRKRRKPTEGD
jgi:hypothetical protein